MTQQIPTNTGGTAVSGDIDLYQLLLRVWSRKFIVIAFTVLGAVASVTYAMLATPIFRADAILSIREDSQRSGLAAAAAGQLGGLADLAGLSVPGSKDRSVAVATLRSRAVIEQFITDRNLVDALFTPEVRNGEKPPTVWDAHRRFMNGIFSVVDDKKSGLVTVSVEWKNPQQATEWVTEIVSRTNDRLRQVAIKESEDNLAYLDAQAKKTNVVEIQNSLYRLAETEIKKLMLARGSGEYAFKTVDPARLPERKIKPRRAVISVIGTMFGGVVGLLVAVLLPDRRRIGRIS